jgi:uncharacterized membrane protein
MTSIGNSSGHRDAGRPTGCPPAVVRYAGLFPEESKMRSKLLVIPALLVLGASTTTHAFDLTSDPAVLSVGVGSEATARLTIRNDEPQMRCVAVDAGTSDERIDVTPGRLSLCVAAGGKATIPVAIRVLSDAEPGSYFVEVTLIGDGVAESQVVDVVVDGEEGD